MECIRCGGNSFSSTTGELIDTKRGSVAITNIPCFMCEKCGEISYTGDTAERIEGVESIFLRDDDPDCESRQNAGCNVSYADVEITSRDCILPENDRRENKTSWR